MLTTLLITLESLIIVVALPLLYHEYQQKNVCTDTLAVLLAEMDTARAKEQERAERFRRASQRLAPPVGPIHQLP